MEGTYCTVDSGEADVKGSLSSVSFIPEEHVPSTSPLPRQAEGLQARAVPGCPSHGAGAVWLLRDLNTVLMLVPGPAKLCLAGELHLCYPGEVGSRRFLLPEICPLTQELINYTLKIAN